MDDSSLSNWFDELLRTRNQMSVGDIFGVNTPTTDPSILAFLNAENSGDRGYRNQQLVNLFTRTAPVDFSGLFGLTDQFGNPSGARMAQQAYQYNKAPQWVQNILPDSYYNAANQMAATAARYGTNPMSQQTAILAAQDAGLFGSDGGTFSGAGDAQTQASLSSDNTGGYYG
jgi:hypothetical protein